MNKQLIEIAKRNSYSIEARGDLETRNSDSEDFIEMSVSSIKAKLEATRVGGAIMAIAAPVALAALLCLCTAYLIDGSFNPFLYFRF